MTFTENNQIDQAEIAHLAYLNWQKDGCPAGHDLNYWIEAECQIRATKHLLVDETVTRTNGGSKFEKARPKAARRTAIRRKVLQEI